MPVDVENTINQLLGNPTLVVLTSLPPTLTKRPEQRIHTHVRLQSIYLSAPLWPLQTLSAV